MVPINIKLGGNGPILSEALACAGLGVTYIGALGRPNINEVFMPMAEKCTLISIANPSHTDAVEFDDGKLIMSKTMVFNDVSWANIESEIGIPKLIDMIQSIDLFGLENWTMLPHMSNIWRHLLSDVLPLSDLADRQVKPLMFFDLADPEKRSKSDVHEAINIIREFSTYFRVILGLNKKEALEIAEIMDISGAQDMDLQSLVWSVAMLLSLYCLVVHPVDCAAAVEGGRYYYTAGPYTPQPKLTTGAGDNFNAGFCIGQIIGLSVHQSLILGKAVSGFYVRNSKSPSFEELLDFLEWWSTQK
jgi:hypothetical protein